MVALLHQQLGADYLSALVKLPLSRAYRSMSVGGGMIALRHAQVMRIAVCNVRPVNRSVMVAPSLCQQDVRPRNVGT